MNESSFFDTADFRALCEQTGITDPDGFIAKLDLCKKAMDGQCTASAIIDGQEISVVYDPKAGRPIA